MLSATSTCICAESILERQEGFVTSTSIYGFNGAVGNWSGFAERVL